jgi:type I restriction-modification system specificity subunit
MNNYESYKETDIPWLGEIPSHWEIKRANIVFEERVEKVSDKDYEPLSVTKNGIFKQLANVAKTNNGDNRKKVLKNDFVINSRSDRKGSSGLSQYDGSVSLINIVLKIRNDNFKFIHYLLKSIPYQEEFYRNGKGIVADLWSTNFQSMSSIFLPIPPISEQIQIANYLDWKINEIDRLILIEKEQIKELENLKQKYIDEIYQNIKSKNFISLSKIGTFFKGGGFSRENLSDSDYGAILYGDIYTKYNYFFEECISKIDENAYFNSKCIDGNVVLFTGSGETKEDIGKSVAYVGTKKIALGGDIIALKPNKNFSPKFIAYFSNTSNIKAFKHMESTGDIIVHITLGAIKSIKIPFITIEEQKDIIKKIDEYILNLKNLIALIEDKIKYFLSLKQSLIAEVVTGKIDVRNITIPQYEKVETIFETDNIDETEVQDYGD